MISKQNISNEKLHMITVNLLFAFFFYLASASFLFIDKHCFMERGKGEKIMENHKNDYIVKRSANL